MLDLGIRKKRLFGIVLSLLIILVGVFAFVSPLKALIGIEVMACTGLVIWGIHQIVIYFKSFHKNGWTLANGIMNIMLGGWIVYVGVFVGRLETFSILTSFIVFVLATIILSDGINKFITASMMKKADLDGRGFVIASGVIDVVLAVFLILSPLFSAITFSAIIGIYMIVGGIALFAESCSSH